MPKTKVAIFAGSDIRDFGGGEKYAIEMSKRLVDVEITFFSARTKSRHRLNEVDVQKLTKSRIVYYNTPVLPFVVERFPLTMSAIREFSTLRNYDTIYNYDPSLMTIIMLRFYAWRFGKKFIFGMHDPDPLKETPVVNTPARRAFLSIYKHIRNFVVFGVKNVRVVNEDEMHNLKRKGYAGRIYYITDFISTSVTEKDIKQNNKEFVVLFAGRLSVSHKGIDLLSKVIEKTLAKNDQIHFAIVGSGDDGESVVKDLMRRYPKNVTWDGFVEEAELRHRYQEASLFAFTSRFESFGLSLAEAQSYGIPAVSFAIKGPKEIIKDHFQGTLVKPFDTDDFANAVLHYYELWKAKKITKALKLKISKDVLSRYGPDVVLPKVSKMFIEE